MKILARVSSTLFLLLFAAHFLLAQEVNDEPCDAISLAVVPLSANPYGAPCVPATTIGWINATPTPGFPKGGCSWAGSQNDVWYTIVVPASGNYTITTAPINGEPVNQAYTGFQYDINTGVCSSLSNLVNCTSVTVSWPQVAVMGQTPGSVHYLRIWSNTGQQGFYNLKICVTETPTLASSSQRVGIGISQPRNNLDVNGNVFIASDITTLGKVGINTINPQASLDVNGNARISGNLSVRGLMDSINLGSYLGNRVSFYGGSGNIPKYGIGIQSNLLQIYSDLPGSNIALGFGNSYNFTERARIINAGEFGLMVNGRLQLKNGTNNLNYGAGMWLFKPDNSGTQGFMGVYTPSLMGFFGGSRGWGLTYSTVNSNLGIGNTNPTRPLSFPAELGEKILLFPGINGETGIGVYANELRLHADNPGGKVSFGTQDNGGIFTEVGKFEKNGAYGLTVYGSIWANGTTYASDGRFKKNIEPLEGALEKVLQLQGVSYQMKAAEFPDQSFDETIQVGLVAQEVEKIVPEVVSTGPNGYKAIDYAKLVPLLIESIKAQQARIDTQQARLDGQQMEIEVLKKKLTLKK